MWFILAFGSSVFAALTSILAKIGIDGVNSNLATAIRTFIVLLMSWGMVFQTKLGLPDSIRTCNRCVMAVLLQGPAAWTSIQSCPNR